MDTTTEIPPAFADDQYDADKRRALQHGHDTATGVALGWEKLAEDLADRLRTLAALTPSLPDVEEFWEFGRPDFAVDFAALERRLRKVIRDAHAMAGDYRLAAVRLADALIAESKED